MHAKIMLLPGSARGEALCRCAEQVLTDVSAAFQHSFSLLREKIGEQSLQAYQEPLTEEAVAACTSRRASVSSTCPTFTWTFRCSRCQ